MDLFLVRHGETQANADGVIQGWLDTELNDAGKQQAKVAAKFFNVPIDAIYCSDLKRAKQTALEFRKKYPDIPYFEDKRVRERSFGEANGQKRDGNDWEVFWAASHTVFISGAETLDAFNLRVRSFLDMLLMSQYERVLIVTHGGTINRVQDLLSGVSGHSHVSYANASVIHAIL